MSKSTMALMLWLFLGGPAWPQENPPAGESREQGMAPDAIPAEAGAEQTVAEDDPTEAGEEEIAVGADAMEEEEESGIVDPDFEDSDLDVQVYEEDDDDFVPSEEIPADEPIPFPSNI